MLRNSIRVSEKRGAGVGLCQKGPNNILAQLFRNSPWGREGGREWGEGGGWVGAKKKIECPLSKVAVLFKTNTIEMADTYCSCHHDMKQKIISIFKCFKEQMPRNRAGWGWEAGWGKYAWRNAQIQMGVSKTCWRGWGLSDFWKNAVSGLGLGFVIKSWALQKQ